MSRSWRRRLAGLLVTLAVISLAACADDDPAPDEQSAPEQASDRELLAEFFDLLKEQDLEGLEGYLSPAFQLQRADGSSVTKADYLANASTVDDYEIHEVHGSRYGNTRIIRAIVSSDSAVNGKRTIVEPGPRLATYTWNGSRWQLAAYANFAALKDGPSTPPTTAED